MNSIAIDDGTKGLEHLVMHTMEQFNHHAREGHLEFKDLFREFGLDGATHCMWDLIIESYPGYPEAQQMMYYFHEAEAKLKDKVCRYNDMKDTPLCWMSH
jgi:hypothetical protein